MGLIVVSGALANKPFNGGAAWTRLSWLLGFERLGFDVFFLEQIDPERCTDRDGRPAPLASSANLEYFRRVTEAFGLAGRSALLTTDGDETIGSTCSEIDQIAKAADLLVNISGNLTDDLLKRRFRRKVFVDLDPGYTQVWQSQGLLGNQLAGHDLYFTVGEHVGTPACTIPADGFEWRPIRQPVVLDCWPVTPARPDERYTTIASWRGPYGRISHGAGHYGLKAHEFRKFIELPTRTGQRFELALDIHSADSADVARLEQYGWTVVDPRKIAGDPIAFRQYVQGSRAEFSVAQGIYVDTNSGWFSDRTTRYLASGKPALVQDTGFSTRLPVGEGLIPFRTLDEAVRGVEAIERDYEKHARVARQIAEELFDSRRVLSEFLDTVGLAH